MKNKLHYLEINEDNKIYKFSLEKIYLNNNTIYYYCSDTHCSARLKVKFDYNLKDEKSFDYKRIKIELTAPHTLDIEEHNYYVDKLVKEDLKYKPAIYIKKEMYNNSKYMYQVIKEESISNKIYDSSGKALIKHIEDKFGNIKINYKDTYLNKIFKKEIDKFKITNKKENLELNDLKNIININIICRKINSYVNIYFKINKKLQKDLTNIKYQGKNISYHDTVQFKRNNKIYTKDIYYYLTDKMIKNLSKTSEIKQWFVDATYYSIPRNNNNYKLLLLLGFNLLTNKTILGGIFLIKNENKETFMHIFEKLKLEYKFNPNTINLDCNIAEILAIKNIFNECNITICYYHILKRLVQHLPQLRDKNKDIKAKAKTLFANMKILLFIKRENVHSFFKLIENKYKKIFPKIINYFIDNYFKKYPLNKLDWNYDISNNLNPIDINHYFFTNNICESTNRTLNMNYQGVHKSLYAFENAILKLIELTYY